jgi:transcriptional regulator with XRE-family HTH domain
MVCDRFLWPEIARLKFLFVLVDQSCRLKESVMSIVEYSTARDPGIRAAVQSGSANESNRAKADQGSNASIDQPIEPYHRLGAVRRLQGVSRRSIARRLQIDVSDVRRQENEYSDLSLSTLYQWQQVLEVPMAELFAESEDELSKPLLRRAQLVRLMKTALALTQQADGECTRELAQAIVDLLVKVMPELEGISAWHVVGKRRRLDELGAAAMRTLSDEFFVDLEE